jgi:hypothetical protein
MRLSAARGYAETAFLQGSDMPGVPEMLKWCLLGATSEVLPNMATV